MQNSLGVAKKVTIKDVAKHAGVALGTVSNYLNGTVGVATETAERIQHAIDVLGYKVNLGARGLRANRTDTVGLVLPNISNPFYAEVARAIEHALWDNGLQTLLCDSSHDSKREQQHLNNLRERRVDGILIIYHDEQKHPKTLIDQLGVPTVYVDRGVEGRRSVTTDNYLGGALAARHLLELGHRQFGLLIGESTVKNAQQRVDGFLAELARANLEVPKEMMIYGKQQVELGYEVRGLLKRKRPPTAIFATNDIVAIGAWRMLLEMGVSIPKEVSLVGFDDIEMGRLLMPALTTVAQNKAAIGSEAASLLLRVLQSETVPLAHITVSPHLEVRGSSGKPKGSK